MPATKAASPSPIPGITTTARPLPLSRILVPTLFTILAIACAIFSTGFLEADEVTHFLFSRSVWHDWHAVFAIWGRLGCTALYALAAPFGVTAARLLAVAVTLATCFGTVILMKQFLRQAGRGPTWSLRHASALTWTLLFAQPCFALNTFTLMTEMLLACCWVWAAVVLLKSRGTRSRNAGILLASFLIGLGGLMRPEGWIAIACWPLYAAVWLRTMQPSRTLPTSIPTLLLATFLAGLPPLFWYLLGVFGKNEWHWVLAQWPWSPKSVYGQRGLLFLLGALVAMAVWIWFPIVAGIRRIARTPARWSLRRKAALLLLVVPFASFFLMHGILGTLGLFGSMALPRYFVCVAPMAAILALMGLDHAERRMTPQGIRRMQAGISAAVLLMLTAFALIGFLPMRAGKPVTELDVIAEILESRRAAGGETAPLRLIAGHPYMLLRMGLPLDTSSNNREFSPQSLSTAAPGTMLVTEPQLWRNEARPKADQLRAWGWREDPEVAARLSQLKPVFDPLMIAEDPNDHSTLWIKN